MLKKTTLFLSIAIASATFLHADAPIPPIISSADRFHPEIGASGMVVSRETVATEEGLKVLQAGGNAIDAAVVTHFVLAVTTPQAGNIGGGGFMIIHHDEEDETVALDYREKAPQAAYRDLFLDEEGNADSEKSRYSHVAAGIPGSVAGMAKALETYGTLSWAEALAPAIRVAREGFPVSRDLAFSLDSGKARLLANGEAKDVFFKSDNTPYVFGEILKLPLLADTLEKIAEGGPEVFYEGEIAAALVADMEANDGIWTMEDLAAYEAIFREPAMGNYQGYTIASMPPPSSGGVHIVQMLNVLEPYDLKALGHNSSAYIHLLSGAMQHAYADRSKHLGDSDFYPVPLEWLTSKEYGHEIRDKLNRFAAVQALEVSPGEAPQEGDQTTHFSIVDGDGNAVSCTTTVNFSFGNKYLVPGLGFFLNNEMDDFSAKPGVPNAYGLVGGEANAIEAEKRMLSSMSPTLILDENGDIFMVAGSPGGSRIITATLQAILNVIDHEMNIAEAVSEARFHNQWLPDAIYFEEGLNLDSIRILESMGYTLRQRTRVGNVNAIVKKGEYLYGAADPRALAGSAKGF